MPLEIVVIYGCKAHIRAYNGADKDIERHGYSAKGRGLRHKDKQGKDQPSKHRQPCHSASIFPAIHQNLATMRQNHALNASHSAFKYAIICQP